MVEPCLYYRNGKMMFIYTFNCIMAGKDSKQIEIARSKDHLADLLTKPLPEVEFT